LVRAVCAACFSAASLIEEAGQAVGFTRPGGEPTAAGRGEAAVLVEDGTA
jgi:hypothetical protein